MNLNRPEVANGADPVSQSRGTNLAIRITLSSVGSVVTSIPWLSHVRPNSMLNHPEQALVAAVVFHTAGIFLVLTLARGYELLAIVIWIACFWLTFPNF